MATGIVSVAMRLDGAGRLSAILLGVGMAAYLLLAAYGWRLISFRREFLANAADPRQAFGFFTFAAASSVLAGAQLLRLPPDPLAASVRGVVSGLSVVLWSCGRSEPG